MSAATVGLDKNTGWLIVAEGAALGTGLSLGGAARQLARLHGTYPGRDWDAPRLRIVENGQEREPTRAEVQCLCDATAELLTKAGK